MLGSTRDNVMFHQTSWCHLLQNFYLLLLTKKISMMGPTMATSQQLRVDHLCHGLTMSPFILQAINMAVTMLDPYRTEEFSSAGVLRPAEILKDAIDKQNEILV